MEPGTLKDIRARHPLGDRIAAYLRDLITSGALAPGERLKVNEVAAMCKVSSIPARDALLTLANEGFVITEHSRGFRIASFTAEDVGDIFLMYAFVSGTLGRQAARLRTDDDLVQLRAIQAKLCQSIEDGRPEVTEKMNLEFHRLLHQIPSRPRLRWTLKMLNRWIPARFFSTLEVWNEINVRGHEEILTALQMQNETAVEIACRDHVIEFSEVLIGVLQERGVFRSEVEQSEP